MSSPTRLNFSPEPQIQDTPGAFPSTPRELEPSSATSSQKSLSQAVYERREEYTVSRKIKIKVGVWNVASFHGTEKDIGAWFAHGKGVSESLSVLSFQDQPGAKEHDDLENVSHQEARRNKKKSTTPLNDHGLPPPSEEIGLYVLGLQEVVDISSAAEAFRPYNDPHPSRKWKHAVEAAIPKGYNIVLEQQLIGLYMVIYASPAIAPTVSSISTTTVRTGLMGYMGNKGAVVARIVLGETTRMVFVNCHLCAGVEKGNLERRNWDASQIQKQTRFESVNFHGEADEPSESIGDEDFAFWFGDLNYRLEGIPGEDVRRLLMLHTKNEYDEKNASKQKIDAELALHNKLSGPDPTKGGSSSPAFTRSNVTLPTMPVTSLEMPQTLDPSSDPSSLQTTIASLLPHDQLHQQMRSGKAFQDGWREGPIDFLPTYKYDVGSVGMFDSSEKKRGPSWCDRILYRTRRDKLDYEHKVQAAEAARKRDQEMKAHGIDDQAVEEEEVLFDYDPATDGAREEYDPDADDKDPEAVQTKAGFEDKIHLEYYTSHQRVLSSDHKPLDAVFTLTYDAVEPELKAKVHREVARDLDKAENESRPSVTVIVDPHQEHRDKSHSSPDHEGVDFGDVCFATSKTRTITIANTGSVPAAVGFTDRMVSGGHASGAAPSWLRIHFDRASDTGTHSAESHDMYTLEPGDAANVVLTISVTNIDLVRDLNEDRAHIEDVLVLRIHNGRDYFLPIHATWVPSAFGRSIGNLIRIPEGGVRKLHHRHDDGKCDQAEGVKWSAPREIFRLTEAVEDLLERAIAEWGMRSGNTQPPWDQAGWPFHLPEESHNEIQHLQERVREALDRDEPVSKALSEDLDSVHKVEAVATTLLDFLKSLEDGVIPESLWANLELAISEWEKARQYPSTEEQKVRTLDVLVSSPAHSTSFTFIASMLSKVTSEVAAASTAPGKEGLESHKNEDTHASIFSQAMIRAPLSSNAKERRATEGRMKRIMEVFTQSDPERQ